MDSINQLTRDYHNVSMWDPSSQLCPLNPCSAFDGDKPLFFDGDHLSGYGSLMIAPSFIAKLEEIWD
jgi:hypothetical protein